MMNKYVEAQILTVRLLSVIDELGIPDKGFIKSVRSIEAFATDKSKKFDNFDAEAHELCVHNFNVIMDGIDHQILLTPRGQLEIEK